jgi:subtilisin family serine protease
MNRRKAGWLISVAVVLALFLSTGVPALANPSNTGQAESIRTIVIFESGVATSEAARASIVRQFGDVVVRDLPGIEGVALVMPRAKFAQYKADPRVKDVEADKRMFAFGKPSAPPGKGKEPKPQPPQEIPTGVDRIDAELNANTGAGIKVAIIDTGIDLDHPDLNVVGNVNFVNEKKSGDDDNGHGTHVAGILAALDNDIGVAGIAPGAELYAVKVLDRGGSGWMSDVIAGIGWAADNGMDVANMSLGAKGTSSALHTAIINARDAGVTIVVAAGNDNADANDYIPATYDEVITISAIVDSDGQPGELGDPTEYGADDTFASFSNWGADIDLAAPGVDIYSTWKGADYKTMSGTSMACPHVAGAAALYIAQYRVTHEGTSPAPAQVLSGLTDAGTPQTEPEGFTGDPDSYTYPEPLVFANATALGGDGSYEQAQ